MTHQRGFTLLEVMAAIAILAIAMVILIESQTHSINNVMRIQNYERGVFITENQLHWTYLDLNEAETWEEYAELSGEDGDYLWEVSLTPLEMENEVDSRVVMLHVVATTRWPEGRGEASFSLETTYLWSDSQ